MDTVDKGTQWIADRYECRQNLGVGSTGSVWLARDHVRKESIALRFLDEETIDDIGGFKEAAKCLRITTHFRHPSVGSVFDFAPYDGGVYISMERQPGVTLRERLTETRNDQAQRFTETAILNLAGTIIDVLQAGVSTGRAHAGIKPENIWLRNDGQVVLSEYGLHYLLPSNALKSSATLLRTGHYLAPEIYEENVVPNFSTDQFALGVLWTEMIQHSDFQEDTKRLDQQRTIIQTLTATRAKDRYVDVDSLKTAFNTIHSSGQSKRFILGKSTRTQTRQRGTWKQRLIWSPLLLLLIPLFQTWLFQEGQDTGPITQRAEIKRIAHELEMDRVRLFRNGFRIEALRPHLETLFSTTQTLDALLMMDSTLSTSLKNIQRSLENERRRTNQGLQLAKTFQRKEMWHHALDHAHKKGLDQASEWKQILEHGQKKSIDSMGLARIGDADNALMEALVDLSKQVENTWNTELQLANEHRATWAQLLKQSKVPYGEPSQNLSLTLDALNQKKTGPERLQSILEAKRIRSVFAAWVEDWKKMPQAPPKAFRNSLGMVFVPVGNMQVSIWETRVIDYFHFIEATGFDDNRSWREEALINTPAHPASTLNRYSGIKFCEWLTKIERTSGIIPQEAFYALPTDLEWSRLAGLENETGEWPIDRHYNAPDTLPWDGEPTDFSNHGNYFTPSNANESNRFYGKLDRYHRTAPVGQFAPNRFGLYDVGGNVMEWVSTNHRPGLNTIPAPFYTLRGGGWRTIHPIQMRVGYRVNPPSGQASSGFRCVLKNGTKDL